MCPFEGREHHLPPGGHLEPEVISHDPCDLPECHFDIGVRTDLPEADLIGEVLNNMRPKLKDEVVIEKASDHFLAVVIEYFLVELHTLILEKTIDDGSLVHRLFLARPVRMVV